MADLSEQSIDAALARGRQARQSEPRARSARFDKDPGRIIVELTNGCSFMFPPHLAQGLETASEDELAQVEILGSGFGLHWEALDVDFSIPGCCPAFLAQNPIWRARPARQARPPKRRRHGLMAPKAADHAKEPPCSSAMPGCLARAGGQPALHFLKTPVNPERFTARCQSLHIYGASPV